MVVEIPAGTNKKIEYNYETNTFPPDVKNGVTRVIDFLPYPGNYGFVPSTLMDHVRGGDGDALDILLIAEHVPSGTVIEVEPIGVIVLSDNGENDTKIIAIPAEDNLKVFDVDSAGQYPENYEAVKAIVKLWFLNYKGGGKMDFKQWGDEKSARTVIEKWKITTPQ